MHSFMSAFTSRPRWSHKRKHDPMTGALRILALSFPVLSFSPSYGTYDGVSPGNTDLRVAYSIDSMATWKAMEQTIPHITNLASPPTTIIPTPLTVGDTLRAGGPPMHVALARLAGTITNALEVPLTLVEGQGDHIGVFELQQSYPNPFNPSTTIRYRLSTRSHVTLTVFNSLGQQVSVLQHGDQDAGYHEVKFDAKRLPSGVYFYRMQAGNYAATKKSLLIR